VTVVDSWHIVEHSNSPYSNRHSMSTDYTVAFLALKKCWGCILGPT